jgi:hypothetical protein
MADDKDDIYVQTLFISTKSPEGPKINKFIGLALMGPEQWDKQKEKPLAELLDSENQPSIMFDDPYSVEDLLQDNPEMKGLVSTIRKHAAEQLGPEESD